MSTDPTKYPLTLGEKPFSLGKDAFEGEMFAMFEGNGGPPCETTAWSIRVFKGVQLRSASNAFNARIVENDGDCRCRRGRFGN
jgi:hypothetical protein